MEDGLVLRAMMTSETLMAPHSAMRLKCLDWLLFISQCRGLFISICQCC
mgnify:CR=1 FL=1